MTTESIEPKYVAGVPLVIITGLSGAGKSTAMRVFEDLGCYCADNLPPSLIPDFFRLSRSSGAGARGVVIASDVRSGDLFGDLVGIVDALREASVEFEVLYLGCSTSVLINRFKEVRRAHPLQADLTVQQAIDEERRRLEPVRAIATQVIDTSGLDAAGLREALMHRLAGQDVTDMARIVFVSFGFKHGMPRDVDFVFDARFLPNPHYVPELSALTGEDDEVYEYVMSSPLAEEYFHKIVGLLETTFDSFVRVGKMTVTVAVGCTGGRHRSVAFARRLSDHFAGAGRRARSVHRDLNRP